MKKIRSVSIKMLPYFIVSIMGLLLLSPAKTMAFTTGGTTTGANALSTAYSAITGGIKGSWGMVAAIVIMALALVGAWEFKKPILFFAGVVAAVLIPHLQDIVNSLGACF